ncbi:polyketide synthase [Ophiocordyceps sinensis CO18]|uniref:Polyketide synthase n=1 Tax=Ophiocordyceps sinensis (strain Co18 / CGMCC 3.14243) TaxID=911162 RepID=T5ANK6_OPHSC|nr:polyketide synthase [Ophiocordyceps sinensis CO18]
MGRPAHTRGTRRPGVRSEAVVPLCFEKSMWTTVAMLGVVEAGRALVLLDPGLPEKRLPNLCQQTTFGHLENASGILRQLCGEQHCRARHDSPDAIIIRNTVHALGAEIDISAALPNQQGQQIQAVAHGCPDPASRGPVDFGLTDGTSQADPVIRAFVVGSILCLAEVDAPLIHNMTAYTLDRLQTLLLQCGSMLWVTSGAYRCSDTPGTCKKNMTQGLLRTVRPETCKAPMELELAAADAGQWG